MWLAQRDCAVRGSVPSLSAACSGAGLDLTCFLGCACEQVLINLRNNRKLLARVKAFDRHCNMVLYVSTKLHQLWHPPSFWECERWHSAQFLADSVLGHWGVSLLFGRENVKEMWTESPRAGKVSHVCPCVVGDVVLFSHARTRTVAAGVCAVCGRQGHFPSTPCGTAAHAVRTWQRCGSAAGVTRSNGTGSCRAPAVECPRVDR